MTGKELVINQMKKNNEIQINIKSLSKGNYLLVARSNDFSATKQIIKN
jgi:hypothetical protein